MLRLIVAAFVILHGLVHLLYFGQSRRLFELRPGMTWPDGSWALSRLVGDQTTRLLASIAYIIAALAFVTGSAAILFQQVWWRPLVVGAAIFSSLLYIIFWNGKMQRLDDQGGIGLLINLAILVALLIFRWPDFGFDPAALSYSENTLTANCPTTEPEWLKPPEDSAVGGSPEFGYYYVNQDRSIWASAWWTGDFETYLRASEEGIKTGWFRPAGAVLEITGQRLDGSAPALHAHVPCCYPTRFQATGLYFPTEGCWEVTAKADGNELSFVVKVYP